MFVLTVCRHHPGQDAARDAARPAHRAWVASGGEGRVQVLIGSAVADEAGRPAGHFGILKAPSPEAARAFAEGDAFFRAGTVASVELTPLSDAFQAHRIAEPMRPAI
jgi:uncharacterized protein YciI